MVEEILPNIYRIEVPLPVNPLKSINSYVIKNSEQNLIIDTGLNRTECREAMQTGLNELDVDLQQTDFFITHLHSDHLALAPVFATDASHIYLNQPDAEKIAEGERWQDMNDHAREHGFSEDELQAAVTNHPGYKYGTKVNISPSIVKEDDIISIGEYSFICVQTPGHTQGHMCLYEPRMKIFISGDHILGDITPTIQSWSDKSNPLYEYLSSLDKVYDLDVDIVLPGHRRIFKNYKERIRELKHHHKSRTEEILIILKKGGKNAFELASEMSWDIDCKSWDLFPAPQKWFATGEALAHLKYLEKTKMVVRKKEGSKVKYLLNTKYSE